MLKNVWIRIFTLFGNIQWLPSLLAPVAIAFPDTIASTLAVFDGSIVAVSGFLAVLSLTVVDGIEF